MANRNPTVIEILKLSYEFERSIAGPGTANWFVEAIYEPTKLDLELLPDIENDRFDLVLVTGNPGDGKSAFLSRLIDEPRSTLSGRQIKVKHDATEPTDPEDRTASALNDLVAFLRPLSDAGWNPAELARSCFVVGINKGLLVNAFLSQAAPFRRLSEAVKEGLRGSGPVEEPVRLAVVDLNKRAAVTLPLEMEDSLLDRILQRVLGPGLWEDQGCAECDDAEWCPFYHNAKRLREDLPKQRFKLVWLIQQLQSERHATIRDILAGLAYILIGHEDMFRMADDTNSEIEHPCLFVERERATDDSLALFRRIFYNAIFVDGDIYEEHVEFIGRYRPRSAERTYGMAPAVIRDYLIPLDPAKGLSNDFWDEIEKRILTNPDREIDRIIERSEHDHFELERVVFASIKDALNETARELDAVEPSQSQYSELLNRFHWLSYLLVRTAKRRAFFFAPASTSALTRLSSLHTFLATLDYIANERREGIQEYERVLRIVIPTGLIRSEDIIVEDERPRSLEVRWSSARDEVGAVLELPLSNPTIQAEPGVVPYVESFPQRLIFKPDSRDEDLQPLTVSLNTFEGLARLAVGYHEGFAGVPKTSQLRNFREALRAQSPEQIVLRDFDDPSISVQVTHWERIGFD